MTKVPYLEHLADVPPVGADGNPSDLSEEIRTLLDSLYYEVMR